MAYFNEDNVTEQMCIGIAQKAGYTYCEADTLREDKSTVIVDKLLLEALKRINKISDEEAQIVVQKVKARIAGGMGGDIITANQNLRKLFFDENSFPFGKKGEYVTINFFDTNPKTHKQNNSYVVTNQWEYPKSSYAGGKRLDVVLLINGIPMVIVEAKTAVNASVTWADGAKDIVDYQKSLPEMFVPNILSIATEGKELYYGSIGAPLTKWGPWFANEQREHGDLKSVQKNLASLIDPLRLLDIYRFFSVFTTDKKSSRKIKVVCRYQQYYGGMAIVNRVMARTKTGIGPKKGLIWHFQGSGKSWLMVFASQMLMKKQELNAPTVVIVDDRRDLRAQITGDFTRAEIPNLDFAYTKEELKTFFQQDQRKILITTIFLFGDVREATGRRSPSYTGGRPGRMYARGTPQRLLLRIDGHAHQQARPQYLQLLRCRRGSWRIHVEIHLPRLHRRWRHLGAELPRSPRGDAPRRCQPAGLLRRDGSREQPHRRGERPTHQRY